MILSAGLGSFRTSWSVITIHKPSYCLMHNLFCPQCLCPNVIVFAPKICKFIFVSDKRVLSGLVLSLMSPVSWGIFVFIKHNFYAEYLIWILVTFIVIYDDFSSRKFSQNDKIKRTNKWNFRTCYQCITFVILQIQSFCLYKLLKTLKYF